MDYIHSEILDAINFIKRRNTPNIYSTISQYYRMLFEYHLTLMFSCIWDRKSNRLPLDMRRDIMQKMSKPPLGVVLECLLQMNEIGEQVFYLSRDYESLMKEYISVRNKNFGHGIVVPNIQESVYAEICNTLENLHRRLCVFEKEFFDEDCEFRMRQDPAEQGQIIVFPANSKPKYRDIEKSIAEDYQQGQLYYYSRKDGNFKISPFVIAKERSSTNYDFYYFTEYKIQNGKFDYLLASEIREDNKFSQNEVSFFTSYRKENAHTICRANGVISNKFANNYDYFVNIEPFTDYVKQIWEFLTKNQSNTCLTIRGSGGIGKTALIHYVCTKYIFEPTHPATKFTSVIFCSAKDRELVFDSMTQREKIRSITSDQVISSYCDILRTICKVLEINIEPDSEKNIAAIENDILNESGLLLIVDDFETLADEEKNKVIKLIDRMSIKRHKVLITTRSQYLVGISYDLNQMNEMQIISFMDQRFSQIFNPNSNSRQKFRELIKKVGSQKIYELTLGLPLLAIQAATLMTLDDFSEKIFSGKIGTAAEEFLLGRLYSYFPTPTLKMLFMIIAFFVKYDLSNISLKDLRIFYRLFCIRRNLSDVDFEKDLQELKKFNIIHIESDYIQVSNKFSYHFFDEYAQEFFENNFAEDFRDEQIFKLTATYGAEKGVLKYIELPNTHVDESLVEIFAFENAAKYSSESRLKFISSFVRRCFERGDREKIQEIYSKGKKYFDVDKNYSDLFAKYGIKTKTVEKKSKPASKVASSNNFKLIAQELEDFRNEIDAALKVSHHAYREERLQALAEELGRLCNVKLKKALENFSDEHLADAQNVEDLIKEISSTKRLDFTGNENCKQLFYLVDQSIFGNN